VQQALDLIDSGQARVSQKVGEAWVTHQWLKKAVLLSFRLNPNAIMSAAGGGFNAEAGVGPWWDKVPNKFAGWTDKDFSAAGFRAVPGSIVRKGSFVGRNVILMPSFVNIGAYVDEGTMIDTWVTVGSCAQIGKNVHLSGGVGIGGVLEPLQANPTIIEDDCFHRRPLRSSRGRGRRPGRRAVDGVFLSATTKIVDRATGEVTTGKVPPYSVVVPGSLPDPKGGPSLYCAVIVKRVDAQTRSKTSINDLLRD